MLAAIAAAFLTRPQLGALYASLARRARARLARRCRRGGRGRATISLRLWPSALPPLLAAAVLGGRLLSGTSPSESLGAYWELWRGYDPCRSRSGSSTTSPTSRSTSRSSPSRSRRSCSRACSAAAGPGTRGPRRTPRSSSRANAVGLLVVAAFTSTPYGYDRLHDRYAFYLFPLWLILFVRWLADGLPRPLVATAIGVGLALVLPAILPFRQLANEAGIDTVPGALWVWLESAGRRPGRAVGTRRARGLRRGSRGRDAARPAPVPRSHPPRSSLVVLVGGGGSCVGPDDRRAGRRGLRGRARAGVDRRAAPGRRARDEALPRVGGVPGVGALPALALPDRVLQRDRRPRRVPGRLDSGRDPARPRERRAGRRARALARATRSRPTTSTRSPASSSRASRLGDGTAANLVLWRDGRAGAGRRRRRRTPTCAPPTAA